MDGLAQGCTRVCWHYNAHEGTGTVVQTDVSAHQHTWIYYYLGVRLRGVEEVSVSPGPVAI